MATAVGTLRASIATVLTDATLWSVYSFPPQTINANSCVISPADPYITPNNNSQSSISPLANFTISLFCPMLDNQGGLAYLEDMIVSAFTKLAASSIVFNVGTVSAPAVMDLPSGALLTSTLNISVLTSWS